MLVIVEKRKPFIAEVTFNRPETRNALNLPLIEALLEALFKLEQDPACRVLILKGAGPVFSSGLDLKEAQQEELAVRSAESLARMFRALHRTPLVTIAAVQGAALAGGAGLIAACDFVVAAETAKIGFPEVRRGLVAAQVIALLVPHLGEKFLKELVLLGLPISAMRAQLMGLATRVVPEEKLQEEAYALASHVLEGAPNAMRKTKALLHELYPVLFEKGLALHHEIRTSEEAKEGMRAFVEKRNPSWLQQ